MGCSWVVRGLSLGLSLSFGTCRACACACSAASTGGTRFARFGAHPLCTMSECTHTSHACPCRYAHARHTHAQTNNIKTYFYVTIFFFGHGRDMNAHLSRLRTWYACTHALPQACPCTHTCIHTTRTFTHTSPHLHVCNPKRI